MMLASFLFTDENIFSDHAEEPIQNDRLYAHPAIEKKDVATKRLRHVQSLMASVGESQVADITCV